MVGIYKITSPSNKVYIGQSWDIEKRLKEYKTLRCQRQPKIYASLKKYGVDSHLFEVVHELPPDIEQAVVDNYEQLYMDLHKDCGVALLNLRGGGANGRPSGETRKKMSARLIGNTRALGKKFTQEHRDKISKSHVGKTISRELVEKLRLLNIGRKASDEAKAKMSRSRKGKKFSQEHCDKIRKALLGRKMNDEWKRKIGESSKGRLQRDSNGRFLKQKTQ